MLNTTKSKRYKFWLNRVSWCWVDISKLPLARQAVTHMKPTKFSFFLYIYIYFYNKRFPPIVSRKDLSFMYGLRQDGKQNPTNLTMGRGHTLDPSADGNLSHSQPWLVHHLIQYQESIHTKK